MTAESVFPSLNHSKHNCELRFENQQPFVRYAGVDDDRVIAR
jgi:hypothetical protein